MIFIYSEKQTERLNYITHHIFNRILGIPFQICTNITAFEEHQGCKINYSNADIENTVSIAPHTLLFEENIIDHKPEISIYKGMPIFFQTKQQNKTLPFDVFSACFFSLSRYEEYLPHLKDKHQRYDEKESLAFKNNFLNLAVVDRWIEELATAIKNSYPDTVFAERKCSFLPTYDVDIAYAYRNKGFLLQTACYIRSLLKCDFKDIIKRTGILLKKHPDPYDTFDYLSSLHRLYNLRPCYFFLVAKKRSHYDRNTTCKNKSFKNLINKLATNADIGLHTSYYAKDFPEKIDFETRFLQKILQSPIVKNRHHYLRFSLPETYRLLESKGIKEEYSMGYVRSLGFRAGTCNPFFFFDLQNNRASQMEVYPFFFMEDALSHVQNQEEIVAHLRPYLEEVIRCKGTLVSLFHNESFCEQKWRTVYEELLSYSRLVQV